MGVVCQTTYQVPETIEEVVRVLNEVHSGSLTVDYDAETVWIYTGDQLVFKANTVAEATAFLQGVLVAAAYWKPYS